MSMITLLDMKRTNFRILQELTVTHTHKTSSKREKKHLEVL